MSDIGFYGIVTALVGVAMLAVAVTGSIVEAVMLWTRRHDRPTRRTSRRVFLGPVIYALVAGGLLVVAQAGTLELREVMDHWSWLVALGAVLPWIAARHSLSALGPSSRQRRRRR